MHNVTYKTEGNKLVITVDTSPAAIAAAPLSSSGKTNLLASTGAALPFPLDGVASATLSLNVMIKRRA